MRREAPVPLRKESAEKDPNHGHLAGGLLHSTRRGWKRDLTRHRASPRPDPLTTHTHRIRHGGLTRINLLVLIVLAHGEASAGRSAAARRTVSSANPNR